MYYQSALIKNKNNPRKTWEIFNKVTGKPTKKNQINEIKNENVILTDNLDIANHFNSFFSTVGQKISSNINNVATKPLSYIQNMTAPNLVFDEIVPSHINDILKNISPKKSTDVDGISCFLLKFVKDEISLPLSHIFNISLKRGVYPDKFKMSRVVPIFKAGDSLSTDNYRPISLISSLGKILDKIVSIKLTNHLDINKLLYKHQFGFQKNTSTEHNLLHLTNFVSTALNEGKFCVGVFLDLKKAFDVVSHKILLQKLKKFGILGTTWDWFNSYLSNRSQRVEINGVLSDSAPLNISVLQGSVLGPILFLCFINDLHTVTDLFLLLFADDTSGLASHSNLEYLIEYCNRELQKITNWMLSNKLAVNSDKCKYIIFHNKGKKSTQMPLPFT